MTTQYALTDSIVQKHTAFQSAAEMRKAMRNGYTPTVSKRKQTELLAALNFDGHTAFVTL